MATNIRLGFGGGGSGTAVGGGLVLGPTTNAFSGATTAAAETARDTYATANSSWLAEYDANPTWAITVTETTGNTTMFQARRNNAWADVTPVARGPRGPRGDQGLQGIQGVQGNEGPQGDPGIQGNEGPQGDPGIQGPRGDEGPEGPQGDTGPQGDEGPEGPQGDPGIQGPQGDEGPEGPTGPRGPQGVPGTQGPAGSSGNADVTGILNAPEADIHLPIEVIVGQTGHSPFAITLVANGAGTARQFGQLPETNPAVGTIAPANTHILELSYFEPGYGVPALNSRWELTVADSVAVQTLIVDGYELAMTQGGLTPNGNRHWLSAAGAYTPTAGDLDFSVRVVQTDGLDLGGVETFATIDKSHLGDFFGTNQDNPAAMARAFERLQGDQRFNREDTRGWLQPDSGTTLPTDTDIPEFALFALLTGGRPDLLIRDQQPAQSVMNRNRIEITPSTGTDNRTWNLSNTYTDNYDEAVGYLRISSSGAFSDIELDLRDNLPGLPGRGSSIWVDFNAPSTLPSGVRSNRAQFLYGFDLSSTIKTYNGVTYRRYKHEGMAATLAQWGTGAVQFDLYSGETGSNPINFKPATEGDSTSWFPVGPFRGAWESHSSYLVGDIVIHGSDNHAVPWMRIRSAVTASSTGTNTPPSADSDWIYIGDSEGTDIVGKLEHLPAGMRLDFRFLDGTGRASVLRSLPPTTGYEVGAVIVVQSSDSTPGILYYLAADFDSPILATDRGDIDITLDSTGNYDPSHNRGTTTLNYHRFVHQLLIQQNHGQSPTTYSMIVSLTQTDLLAASNPVPNNVFMHLDDNAFATLIGVGSAGGLNLQISNFGYQDGVTVQNYVYSGLTATQASAFQNRRIQAVLRNGSTQFSPVLAYRPATQHIGNNWRQLGGATGGMGAVGQGELTSNPVATNVVTRESLSPPLRAQLDPRFEITGTSSNLSYNLIGWLGSHLTSFDVSPDVPFLPATVTAIGGVNMPDVYQTASSADDYHRYIDYPDALTAPHGFELSGFRPLANTGDSLVVYMTVHPYSLPAVGSRTLLSFPQITGRSWDLRVDASGNLILHDGTPSVNVASALAANTVARVKVQIVRLADVAGGNQQYRGYLQVGSGSSVNYRNLLGVTSSGNVLDSSPTVVVGNSSSNPSTINSYRGWIADLILASGTGGTEAPAPGVTLNRTSPYGTLFSIGTTTTPDSVLAMTPLANLLDAPVSIPSSAPVSIALDDGWDPDDIEGFWLELQIEANYSVRGFVPRDVMPIRTAAQASLITDHQQTHIAENNGFFGFGRGESPTTGSTFTNSFYASLVGDSTFIRAFHLWSISQVRGTTLRVNGIWIVPRRRH